VNYNSVVKIPEMKDSRYISWVIDNKYTFVIKEKDVDDGNDQSKIIFNFPLPPKNEINMIIYM